MRLRWCISGPRPALNHNRRPASVIPPHHIAAAAKRTLDPHRAVQPDSHAPRDARRAAGGAPMVVVGVRPCPNHAPPAIRETTVDAKGVGAAAGSAHVAVVACRVHHCDGLRRRCRRWVSAAAWVVITARKARATRAAVAAIPEALVVAARAGAGLRAVVVDVIFVSCLRAVPLLSLGLPTGATGGWRCGA